MAYNGGVNQNWALNSNRMSVAVNNSVNLTTLNWCPTCGVCNNYNLLIDSYFMNRSNEASSGPMCFCTSDLSQSSLLNSINRMASTKSAGPFDTLLDGMNWVRTNGIFVTNQNYPSLVTSGNTLNLDAGLPASYPMVGTNWYDLTANNNNNGTLVNGVTYNSTLKGFLSFNGSNQYVSFTTPTNIPISNSNYTISVWFSANTLGTRGLVGWGNYGSTNQVNAFRLSSSGLVNYWQSNDLSATIAITTGSWYNAVATFDGTTRSIWVNGSLINSDTPTGHNVPNANNLTIGVTNTTEYFSGSIGEVQIFNRGLSSNEILNNYNGLLTRYNDSNTEICVSPIYCVTQTPTPTPTPTDVSLCIPQTFYNYETYNQLRVRSYSSFKPDGTQVYFTQHNNGLTGGVIRDPIIVYNLEIPWDVSTIIANGTTNGSNPPFFPFANPAAVSIDTAYSTGETQTLGHYFSPDGLRVFTCGGATGLIQRYDLSVAWDITTMTLNSSTLQYTGTTGTSVRAIKFSGDGLTMILLGSTTARYTLSSPWVITGGTLQYTATGNSLDIDFQNNGLYLFTFNSVGTNLIRKTLSSPYNITGVTSTQTLNISTLPLNGGSSPTIHFKDGYKGYISVFATFTGNTISAFNLTCNYDISGSLVAVTTPTPTPTNTITPTNTTTQTPTPTNVEIFNARWDTLSYTPSNNAFDIRRSSDNVTQTFSYTQIIDGTYDTFLTGGNTGYVSNWYGDNYNLTNGNTTYQPKLIPNSGNPYNYSYTQGTCLLSNHGIQFLNDWIITIVLNGEENSNNQRANLTIATSTKVVLAFQIATSSTSTYATLLYEKNVSTIATNMIADLKFNISNPNFKLVTFRYVGGVLSAYTNNTLVTLTNANADAYTIGMSTGLIGKINLGATRGIGGNIGKVNKYKHLSILSGPNLSSFDISAYNLEIITRYSIT